MALCLGICKGKFLPLLLSVIGNDALQLRSPGGSTALIRTWANLICSAAMHADAPRVPIACAEKYCCNEPSQKSFACNEPLGRHFFQGSTNKVPTGASVAAAGGAPAAAASYVSGRDSRRAPLCQMGNLSEGDSSRQRVW